MGMQNRLNLISPARTAWNGRIASHSTVHRAVSQSVTQSVWVQLEAPAVWPTAEWWVPSTRIL